MFFLQQTSHLSNFPFPFSQPNQVASSQTLATSSATTKTRPTPTSTSRRSTTCVTTPTKVAEALPDRSARSPLAQMTSTMISSTSTAGAPGSRSWRTCTGKERARRSRSRVAVWMKWWTCCSWRLGWGLLTRQWVLWESEFCLSFLN